MEADTTQIPNSGRARQIITSFLVAVMTLYAGMVQGWQSPMALKLNKEDSPVETMSKDELANLATIPGYFGLVVSFIIGFLAQKFGRKIAMYAIGTVSAVGGVILTIAPTKLYLYIGRTLSFVGGTAVSLAPMFISETAHESIRGTLMAVCTLQLNIGILIAYAAGAKLPFKIFNALYAVIPILYTIALFLIPESPLFLVEKHRMEAAKKSMSWYKGGNEHTAELELERVSSSKSKDEKNMTFCEILKSKVTRLAMIISVGGYVFQAFSGIFAILNYAGIIFDEAGSSMSPENSSIVIAVILFAASVVNVLTMDKLGRKALLYFSFIGNAIGMTVLSLFLYVRMKGADVGHLGWIPVSSVGLFAFTYGVGLAAVPGAILNEVSPTAIRPTVGVIVMVLAFLILNGVVQIFPYMDDNIGLYSVFIIPAVANILGVFFTFFIVPETKGKSLVEIEEELKNR